MDAKDILVMEYVCAPVITKERHKMEEIEYKSKTLAPAIELYEGILEDCDDVIALAQSMDGWREATFFSPEDTHKKDSNIRNTRILDAPYHLKSHVSWFVLSQMLYSVAEDYCRKWRTGFNNMEHPQILHYTAGEGHYNAHADAGPGVPRNFSAVLYLNDVEEGGETHFTHFDLTVAPKAGSLIMFPAEYPYVHEARPPLSNDKFAVVTWFRPWIESPNHGH